MTIQFFQKKTLLAAVFLPFIAFATPLAAQQQAPSGAQAPAAGATTDPAEPTPLPDAPAEVTPTNPAPPPAAPSQQPAAEPSPMPGEPMQPPADLKNDNLRIVDEQSQNDQQKPAAEMQAVLDKLVALGAKPVSTLSVPDARMQPSPADAAKAVQWEKKISSAPESKVMTRDIAIPTKAGAVAARVYMPEGNGPFPVVVYYHGGGWVIADLNVYDATPRALALNAGAIVVSVDYRHAPEHKFPAAHNDAWSAYAWVVENIHSLNGDSKRIAVAGESAGGNLATNVALMAKKMKATMPVHQLLVYPVAGNDTNTPSYNENADAVPLGKKDMEWFISHVFQSKEQTADPRVNLVGRNDLNGLPSATVITAQFDPLRSEGQAYAQKLKDAGVEVNAQNYDGVTHEFFGMAKVVPQAKQAMDLAVSDLKTAFSKAR